MKIPTPNTTQLSALGFAMLSGIGYYIFKDVKIRPLPKNQPKIFSNMRFNEKVK